MSAPHADTVALTPLVFLGRAADVFGDTTAILDGDRSFTHAQFAAEAQALARALRSRTSPGDRVAFLSPNSAELLFAHFGVPLAGDVLVALNTRLAVPELGYILDHSGAGLLVVHQSLLETGMAAAESAGGGIRLIVIGGDAPAGATTYESFVAPHRDGAALPWSVDDERSVISLNYTSGTTGKPKGVMYTHRGAYLNSLGFLHHGEFDRRTRYLWTLPMFHCNGWCTTWAVTAGAGVHVCLGAVREEQVWQAIDTLGITHLCGAPTVLDIVAHAPRAHALRRPLRMITGGAPPSPATIERLEELGIVPMHAYGLTEVYGPYTICEPQDSWRTLPRDERARRMARQGVRMLQSGAVRVVDHDLSDVPADGITVGEIVMRGNNVMLGYFRDEDATERAFAGGWFHSGDLGVMHPDGYLEVIDRAKDVIISGGENISSIEVENALMSHPAVADAGVVGIPDKHWGERPVAFVVLREDTSASDLAEHLRARIARFKVPDRIDIVGALPRTSTGKVLKSELRDVARRAGGSIREPNASPPPGSVGA